MAKVFVIFDIMPKFEPGKRFVVFLLRGGIVFMPHKIHGESVGHLRSYVRTGTAKKHFVLFLECRDRDGFHVAKYWPRSMPEPELGSPVSFVS